MIVHGCLSFYQESNMSNDGARRNLNETLATAITGLGGTTVEPVDELSDADLGTVSGGVSPGDIDPSTCGFFGCSVFN